MFKLFKYLLYCVRILLWSIKVGFYLFYSYTLYSNLLLSNHFPVVQINFLSLAVRLTWTSTSASVVQQVYQSEVNNEYVILGNAAVLKCSIPSFVADFVSVISWQDDQGDSFANDISSSQYGIGKLQRITRIPDQCLLLIGFSTTLVYLITQK